MAGCPKVFACQTEFCINRYFPFLVKEIKSNSIYAQIPTNSATVFYKRQKQNSDQNDNWDIHAKKERIFTLCKWWSRATYQLDCFPLAKYSDKFKDDLPDQVWMSTTPLRTHPHCVKITPAPLGFLVSVENMNQWARGGMKIALPYQNENRVTSRFNL